MYRSVIVILFLERWTFLLLFLCPYMVATLRRMGATVSPS